MSQDHRQLCIVCAWRASCAKRFSMGSDQTLHCPDFSEDVTLRKRETPPAAPADEQRR